MRGLKFSAIIVGALVDVIVSILLGVPFAIILIAYHTSQGMTMAAATEQIQKEAHSVLMLLASIGLGGTGSLVGGFVAGWMARHHRVTNGAGAGILSVLLSVFAWSGYPLWFNLLGVVITVGLAASGAYLSHLIFGTQNPPAPPLIVHP